MAASQYLSKKEEQDKHALKSSFYTGLTYFIVVMILILPYFLFSQVLIALGVTLAFALIVIFMFSFYTSVARHESIRNKFIHMALISLGVAILNFGIGFLVNKYFLQGA